MNILELEHFGTRTLLDLNFMYVCKNKSTN